MSDKFVKMVTTFFYIGNFPVAPGTLASFAGMLLYFIIFKSIVLYVIVLTVVTVIGFLASGKMEKLINQKDPSCVVIDEVSGILISFFMVPLTIPTIITTFFLFRAFDMFKIYPVNRFEELGGGVGIMMDDVVAGLYTCVTMHLALRIAGM